MFNRLMASRGVARLLGGSILLASLIAGWFILDYRFFLNGALKNLDEPMMYEIKKGMSIHHVARELVANGLIDHPQYLKIHARLSGRAGRIHIGEYLLEPGMTPRDLFANMVNGKVLQYPVTIIDGWTFKQLLAEMKTMDWLEHSLDGKSITEISQLIGIDRDHPEGLLLADTYHVTRGTRDVEVLRRAVRAMNLFIDRHWPERAVGLPYKSPYEALIMASIIEKETAVPEERAEIAGVFVRRLQKRMRLQTDPTVIYGMGEAFDGNIRRRDLKRDTPYNTYTRSGLPHTPIAMPGTASIMAALHPADGETLYFVARGDGSHYFSESHEEHLQAVRKYQLRR